MPKPLLESRAQEQDSGEENGRQETRPALSRHMKTNQAYLKQLIEHIGYKPVNGGLSKYCKTYEGDYTITVNFNTAKIDYPAPMTLGDKTTCHFEASENFVVLECVDRLLEKGYKPENLTLEKKWGLGHREKGKADIVVYHPKKEDESEGKPFLIIECKTLGAEFEKEFQKTLANGGQLLSYYQQEQQTELLCLYTSVFEDDEIRYTNRIIKVEESFKGKNKAESFKTWKEDFGLQFKYNGIFDDDSTPYNVELKPLKRKDLVHLQASDSGYIYNQFAEILRHNVVSDKPNAFNKMFNLILAKFLDEDRGPNEILDFQWLETDDDITLQKRLNDLYKRGMNEYLNKQVTDFSDEEQQALLEAGPHLSQHFREALKKAFTELRLYKNNEFSFKEVFNEKSFSDNAVVVKETVKLLQAYQLRYSHKQQFLSNFFELLLSNTLKQEAGQFFTPVPIAKFITSSIPLKEITEQKIEQSKNDFLPHIIDFAAGSGHFLTEAMDALQHVIENLPLDNLKPSVRRRLINWQAEPYEWARDYIYGIEKDYRLAKIAKVSCFLSGDGLANIIHADGLDSFDSPDYEEAPLLHTKKLTKENQKFDVLAANPPYSVQAFIKTLPKGDRCFELFDDFTEQSKEIEILFIERAKQLLKDGGFVGIILPSSILNNAGIYTKAREILLSFFRIVAVVEFGKSTFMATGTNTIALFLERRSNIEHQDIKSMVEGFFNDQVDRTCNGITKAFSRYAEYVHHVSLNDYASFVARQPNETFKGTELYGDYERWYANLTETKNLNERIIRQSDNLNRLRAQGAASNKEREKLEQRINDLENGLEKLKGDVTRLFYEKVFEIERDKMLYFFLTLQQNVLLINADPSEDKEKEREFLGYEFSERRGHEGIKMFTDVEGNLTTKLYDPNDHLNSSKVNSYIYRTFLNEPISEVHESLREHIQVQNLAEMITFNRVESEKAIVLARKKKVLTQIGSKWNQAKIGDVCEIVNGGTPKKSIRAYWDKGHINWATLVDVKAKYLYSTKRKINQEGLSNSSAQLLPINTILFSSKATIGEMAIAKVETTTNQDFKNLICKPDLVHYEYLYQALKRQVPHIKDYTSGLRAEITTDEMREVRIPLPPLNIQEQIVREISVIEEQENNAAREVEKIKSQIKEFTGQFFAQNGYPQVEIGKVCDVKGGKRLPLGSSFSPTVTEYPFIRVTDFKNHSIDLTNLKYITKDVFDKIAKYTLSSEDVYLSITGTVGLVVIAPDVLNGKPFTDNVAKLVIRNRDQLLKTYLMYFLASEFGQAQMLERVTQVSVPKLALKRIETIKIPMAPVPEQRQFVSRIQAFESEIARLEKELEELNAEQDKVLQKYL